MLPPARFLEYLPLSKHDEVSRNNIINAEIDNACNRIWDILVEIDDEIDYCESVKFCSVILYYSNYSKVKIRSQQLVDIITSLTEDDFIACMREWTTVKKLNNTEEPMNNTCACSNPEGSYIISNAINKNSLIICNDCVEYCCDGVKNAIIELDGYKICASCACINKHKWDIFCSECRNSGNCQISQSYGLSHGYRQCQVCLTFNIPPDWEDWRKTCLPCFKKRDEDNENCRECATCHRKNITRDKALRIIDCGECYKTKMAGLKECTRCGKKCIPLAQKSKICQNCDPSNLQCPSCKLYKIPASDANWRKTCGPCYYKNR